MTNAFSLEGKAMELGEPGEPGPDPPGLRINSKGSRYSRDSSGSWDSGVSVETSNASNPSNLSSPSKRKKQFFKSCTATRDFDTIELHPTSGRIIRVLTNCLNSTWLDVFSGTAQDSVATHSEQTIYIYLQLYIYFYTYIYIYLCVCVCLVASFCISFSHHVTYNHVSDNLRVSEIIKPV